MVDMEETDATATASEDDDDDLDAPPRTSRQPTACDDRTLPSPHIRLPPFLMNRQ